MKKTLLRLGGEKDVAYEVRAAFHVGVTSKWLSGV
jgi:hypothetical protein